MRMLTLDEALRVLPKELRPLARQGWDQDWRFGRTGGGHVAWLPPAGGDPVYEPATPNKGRHSLNNIRADLKRAGLTRQNRRKRHGRASAARAARV